MNFSETQAYINVFGQRQRLCMLFDKGSAAKERIVKVNEKAAQENQAKKDPLVLQIGVVADSCCNDLLLQFRLQV